jgi:protein TonB
VIEEAPAQIMKLTNVDEDRPPPPPPPPPEEIPPVLQNTIETVADVMEETDEPIENIEVSTEIIAQPVIIAAEPEEYLPMHRISVPPVFSEQELRQRVIYPVIALRSGIEGTVFLELFIDKSGDVQNIVILKEDPVDRGFGEAAVKAFQGFHCTPAQANGVPVAVRYRYPLRFVVR